MRYGKRRKVRTPHFTRAEDEVVLTALDLFHGDNLTTQQVADHMGVTRGSIIGKVHRVGKDETPDDCHLPENKDQGMPRGWWRK